MSIYELEQDGDTAELRRLLAESDSEAVRARAAAALGETDEGSGPVVADLIEAARTDPERAVRTKAVEGLTEIGGPALRRLFESSEGADADGQPAVETFVTALDHEMAAMRMAAAAAIASEGANGAAPALLDRLDDPVGRVRLEVVRALGQLREGRAIDPLAERIPEAPSRLQAEIATALGEIGTEAAIEPIAGLVDVEETEVRRRAVEALGQFGSESAAELLVGCLEDDADTVRRTAVFSIVEVLSNAPPATSHELRSAVVEDLTTAHGEVVTDALVELFDESAKPHQRRNAAWLLGRVTEDRTVAVETLVEALGDDDETVRRFAATSLTEMDEDLVEESLLEAVDDSHGEGRSMIVFTLGKVGTDRSRERLTRLLDETDDLDLQERILTALSKLGGV